MHREAIHVAEYEKLMDQFTAEKFDADFITDLALEAEMRYVTITTRHHDSFCLFDSSVSDLIGELAGACQEKGLGLFLYYSYALDWRHPYFYPRSIFRIARPDYRTPEPRYKWQRDEDFRHLSSASRGPTTGRRSRATSGSAMRTSATTSISCTLRSGSS